MDLSRFMRERRSWRIVVVLPWAFVVHCDLVEMLCSKGEVGKQDMEEVIKASSSHLVWGRR